MTLCKKQPSQRKKGSPEGCEALDIPQVVCLFQTLCAIAYPWAAALMMVQLFLGERADAARSVECAWLKNVILESDLEEGEAEAPILDLPEICLPGNINKKTGERAVALDCAFSDLLRGWLQRKPLLGARGTQWPWEAQDVKGAHHEHAVLFPGKDTRSQERLWQVPVSERAYHHAIRKAVQEIARARVGAEKLGKTHVFTDVDLSRVSTHAIKKTRVSLLSERGTSMSVIAAITNTSVPVVKRHYDAPTNSRKRRAVTAAFGHDVAQGIAAEMSDSPSACTSPVRAVSNETDDVSQPQLDMYCPWRGRSADCGVIVASVAGPCLSIIVATSMCFMSAQRGEHDCVHLPAVDYATSFNFLSKSCRTCDSESSELASGLGFKLFAHVSACRASSLAGA